MTGRSKRNMSKATNLLESFPDDVLFEILLRVPAHDLYDSTRLVCRKWYNMIHTRNFAHSHFQRLTPLLLTVDRINREQAIMTMQNGRIEISKWSYMVGHRLVLSSCNGLVLESNSNPKGLYITNHVTKQHFALPPFLPEKVMTRKLFALAYVASSCAYKVVGVSYPINRDRDLVCAIMTVGVDTDWRRRVSTQHLSLKAKKLFYCMNVESETITQIPGPCLRDDGESLWCRYIPTESYLSLFIGRGEFSWEVWKMKPEIGKWTKMPSINLEPQKVPKYLFFEFEQRRFLGPMLKPIGWSNSLEVLFFKVCFHTGIFVAYNFRTREIDSCNHRVSPAQKQPRMAGLMLFMVFLALLFIFII
ncbi:hypothetical protein CASFOL_004473 [Castilleja foliolosa]|uniref:F-box domain-containing protein n=1 Tax=Castilleja foliolosa TaxID=1961234 RepID=A0ABD3EAN5_9LAMI